MTVKQITDGINSKINGLFSPSYKQLSYIQNVEANNFIVSKNGYGARPLSLVEFSGAVKTLSYRHTFEIVFTKGYLHSNINDNELNQCIFDLYSNTFDTFAELERTKIGLPAIVLNVDNLLIQEPQILDEDKVVVLRANVDVLYRFNL